MFDSLLNNEFTHERRTRAHDGQGGWSIGYSGQGTVRGRIRPASSQEREVAMAEERQITHVFYTLADEDIQRGDRLTCDDLVVEVEAVREPSLMGHHLEVDCMERQKEE